jgi:squalene synthase HpnC
VQSDVTSHQHNREAPPAPNQDQPPANALTSRAAAADEGEWRLAERETRKLAKSHYENFVVASVLLPRRLRQPFFNLYAFCRTADDLADESESPQIAMQKLAEFQDHLDQTYLGHPPNRLFLALSGTIREYGLSKCFFDDLLDAFRQDQRQTCYADFDSLLNYCCRSANPVGRLVLQLAGCHDGHNGRLSDQICTGLQLANFWQDVARDFQIGRIYLPADQRDRFGVTESMLGQPSACPELRALLASECERAEGFFRRGLALTRSVPRWLAGDVKLFAHGGMATLQAIRDVDHDVLASRPTVSKWRQGRMVVLAMLGLL